MIFEIKKNLNNGRPGRERGRIREQGTMCCAAARSEDFLPPVVPDVLCRPLLRTDFTGGRRHQQQGLRVSDSSAGAVGAC
jgi:hypothetical protein